MLRDADRDDDLVNFAKQDRGFASADFWSVVLFKTSQTHMIRKLIRLASYILKELNNFKPFKRRGGVLSQYLYNCQFMVLSETERITHWTIFMASFAKWHGSKRVIARISIVRAIFPTRSSADSKSGLDQSVPSSLFKVSIDHMSCSICLSSQSSDTWLCPYGASLNDVLSCRGLQIA